MWLYSCSVLQCVVVCCSELQCCSVFGFGIFFGEEHCAQVDHISIFTVAVCCSMLPCIEMCCNVLQCVAMCCSLFEFRVLD